MRTAASHSSRIICCGNPVARRYFDNFLVPSPARAVPFVQVNDLPCWSPRICTSRCLAGRDFPGKQRHCRGLWPRLALHRAKRARSACFCTTRMPLPPRESGFDNQGEANFFPDFSPLHSRSLTAISVPGRVGTFDSLSDGAAAFYLPWTQQSGRDRRKPRFASAQALRKHRSRLENHIRDGSPERRSPLARAIMPSISR